MSSDLVDASGLCWTFAQTGFCPRGAMCRWSHESLTNEDTVCRAWLLWGNCPRIESCRWAHPPVCMKAAPANQVPTQVEGTWTEDPAAGQLLLSMLQTQDDQIEGNRQLRRWVSSDDSDDAAEKPTCRTPSTRDATPMALDVALEDMCDTFDNWNQFEVNRKLFGVTTLFKDDLSQYTTPLDVANIPAEIKKEADRIAAEIEVEHVANGRLHGDDDRVTHGEDSDEEAKFSAVSRQARPLAV